MKRDLVVNQLMLYVLHKTTKQRIGYLFWRAVTILTKPIDKMVCRRLGHEKIWVLDGWPYQNIRHLCCTRCGESKTIQKNTKLTPRLIIYHPKTKAFIKIEPIPEAILEEG